MNKLFTKIVGTCLGLAMAVGTGVAVAAGVKEATPVYAATSSVSFISSGYTYNSTVADLSGEASTNSGTKFWAMYGGATLTTKSSYSIDTTVSTSISLHARKYGTVTGGKEVMTFNILDASNNSVLASNTLTPTSTTPTAAYSGTIAAFDTNTNKSVKFQLKSASNSTNAAFCGMTEASFTYTQGYESTTVEATGISFDESVFEVYAGDSVSFTPTLTGGSGAYEKTIAWSSDNTSVIASPSNSEDGATVTVTPNNVAVETDVTITGTVVSPGSASDEVLITVKPARTVDHYSVTGSATATTNSAAWDLSAVTLHAWYDAGETEEKTLVKGTDYSLTTSTAIGGAGTKDVTVTDSLGLISGSWVVSGTVTQAPVESSVTIDTTNTDQVTTNSTSSVVFTEGIVTVTIGKGTGTNANNYLGQGDNGTRVYANGTITVSVSGANTYLKTVEFNKTVNNSNAVTGIGTSSWTGGTAATSTGKLTVTANSNTQSVSHTTAAKSDIGSIVVTYEAPYTPVTSVSLVSNSITMTSYDEERIVASVLPVNASVGGVTFGGYDTEIISVDANGNITPIGYGLTTVTVTSKGTKSDSTHATATCAVKVDRATFKEAKYTYSSAESVTPSGDIVDGSSATYSSGGTKFGTTDHLTTQTATLTVSGMDGYIVETVAIKLHSEAESGSASLSVTAGSTTLKTISSAAFSDSSWNGEYSADNVVVKIAMTNDEYEIQDGENVVLTFTSTVSGFYITDYRIRYVKATVDTSAVEFAQKILDELSCNSAGTSAPSVSEWNALKTYYQESGEVSDAAKTTLYEAAASDHDYDPLIDTTDVQIIAAAMAKYDYVIAKYGSSTYNDFINRNPAPLSGSRILLNNVLGNNGTAVSIIVVVSLVSLTAIGGYFFLRKRKEQ